MKCTHCLVLAVLALAVGTGCGNTRWLLSANFENQSGSPHGSIPGEPPSGDSITVGNGSSTWPKISSGRLLFPRSSSFLTQFRSAKAKKDDSKRTVSWTGQIAFADNDPPFNFNIGGWETGTTGPEFPLRLKLFSNKAELRKPNSDLMESDPLPDTSANWTHSGTIILRLDTGSYKVIIKNSTHPNAIGGAPTIEWDGTIPPATLNELRDKSRMKIEMVYSGPNTENGQFSLDKITIKENWKN